MSFPVFARRALRCAVLLLCSIGPPLSAAPLTLAEAERLALLEDPGARALEAHAEAARERAVADSQLPDPVVSIAAQNFPVDTFAFDQERMTQLRLGVRQQVPGGDTLAERRALGDARAGGYDAQTALRRRDVLRAVRLVWIDLAWLQRERTLLESTGPLLSDLEATAVAGYRQGHGSQQDVLRARLERDALRDRLLRNAEARDRARAELARWIGSAALDAEPLGTAGLESVPMQLDAAALQRRLELHPRLAALSAREGEEDARVGLAQAAYHPDWGIEVGYGIRDRLTPFGDTPDFLTAAVTFELPLFTAERQDRALSAARSERESARASRVDALRELMRDWWRLSASAHRLDERLALHDDSILPHAEQTAEAARRGYGADAGDFPEVMRTALAALDARIERSRIHFERLRVAARLAWLVPAEEAQTP